jgi:hypothetical protein
MNEIFNVFMYTGGANGFADNGGGRTIEDSGIPE